MSDLQNVIERVLKLQKLATSSNVNEAAAAAAKAEELIAKYRIEQADLEVKGEKKEVSQSSKPLYSSARVVPWKKDLAILLARHYDIYLVNVWGVSENNRNTRNYVMFGTHSDVEVCRYMFHYLSNEISRLADMNVPQFHRGVSSEKLSYCSGAVHGIMEKLSQEKNAQTVAAQQTGHSAALVKLDEHYDEAKALAHRNMKITQSKDYSKQNINYNRYMEGRKDGKNIQVNSGLGTSNYSNKLLKE